MTPDMFSHILGELMAHILLLEEESNQESFIKSEFDWLTLPGFHTTTDVANYVLDNQAIYKLYIDFHDFITSQNFTCNIVSDESSIYLEISNTE